MGVLQIVTLKVVTAFRKEASGGGICIIDSLTTYGYAVIIFLVDSEHLLANNIMYRHTPTTKLWRLAAFGRLNIDNFFLHLDLCHFPASSTEDYVLVRQKRGVHG
ncbi:hypothetical protein D3C81_597060 [compost metagenome]